MVTSVRSTREIGLTPSGKLMSLRCLRMVDLELGDIDVDRRRDRLRLAHAPSMVWVTMLTVPPRLTPGDWSALITCTGTATRITAPSPSRMKSTWIGLSRTGSSWKSRGITRCFSAVDLELVDRGQEPAGIDALPEVVVVERDGERGFVIAVDHAGYAAGATLCPGGPLAGPRSRHRLQFLNGRHDKILVLQARIVGFAPAACLQGCWSRGRARV